MLGFLIDYHRGKRVLAGQPESQICKQGVKMVKRVQLKFVIPVRVVCCEGRPVYIIIPPYHVQRSKNEHSDANGPHDRNSDLKYLGRCDVFKAEDRPAQEKQHHPKVVFLEKSYSFEGLSEYIGAHDSFATDHPQEIETYAQGSYPLKYRSDYLGPHLSVLKALFQLK